MNLDALIPWLVAKLGADEVILEESWRPPFNGVSNDTLLVRARWRLGQDWQEGGFVVRRSPVGPSVYQRYDLESQYRTMAALQNTHVPVPPLVGNETDTSILELPFYVMYSVKGQAPPDIPPFSMTGWVLEASADQQRRLYETSVAMLGSIHRLDASTLELGHLPQGFDVQFEQTEAWFHWAAEGREYPVLEATLAWLRENRPALREANCLNWGDARLGNMLYEDFEPVCVLDWEMAAVGPPEVDLGWWMFVNRHHTDGIGIPQLAGFPDDDTTIQIWEQAAGRRAQDVFYYDIFAGFRFGIIVLRDSIRAIEAGTQPDLNHDRDNTVTRLLTKMLDL